MRGNLETDGMIGTRRRNEKRSERREGEKGKEAGGGRRPCLLICKQHWLPIRRRRRGGKQINSRSLKEEPRRAERSKTEACKSRRMKSPSRRMNRHSLLLVSRCRRIQVEMVCKRRMMVAGRRR